MLIKPCYNHVYFVVAHTITMIIIDLLFVTGGDRRRFWAERCQQSFIPGQSSPVEPGVSEWRFRNGRQSLRRGHGPRPGQPHSFLQPIGRPRQARTLRPRPPGRFPRCRTQFEMAKSNFYFHQLHQPNISTVSFNEISPWKNYFHSFLGWVIE